MTPRPQKGLNYSYLGRIAMERAHAAREAARSSATHRRTRLRHLRRQLASFRRRQTKDGSSSTSPAARGSGSPSGSEPDEVRVLASRLHRRYPRRVRGDPDSWALPN